MQKLQNCLSYCRNLKFEEYVLSRYMELHTCVFDGARLRGLGVEPKLEIFKF